MEGTGGDLVLITQKSTSSIFILVSLYLILNIRKNTDLLFFHIYKFNPRNP